MVPRCLNKSTIYVHWIATRLCVLSPILFAIYMADLGAIFENSNLGAQINMSKVIALMFASNIALMGNETEVMKACKSVANFAEKNKIEFSGPKSIVIPTHRKPNATIDKWKLGTVVDNDNTTRCIPATETETGKYLGVTIQRKENIFKPQLTLALKKAEKSGGFIAYLLKKLNNPVTLFKTL